MQIEGIVAIGLDESLSRLTTDHRRALRRLKLCLTLRKREKPLRQRW